ncbi:MAG: TFIIB-type zinc ribbon-containing protein [Candidatus Bathyarchaeia archaeon]
MSDIDLMISEGILEKCPECEGSLILIPGDEIYPTELVCSSCGLVVASKKELRIVPEAEAMAPENEGMFGKNLGSFGRTRDEATLLAVRSSSEISKLIRCPKCNHRFRIQVADPRYFKANLTILKKLQMPEHPSLKRGLEILKRHSEECGFDPATWSEVGAMFRKMVYELTRLPESQIREILNLALSIYRLPLLKKKG